MTGCLQIKNGMYYIVLSTYENGKRKRPWIPTGLPAKGNKRKAEQMLREKVREYELNSGNAKANVLLSDYVRYWLTIARRKVDDVTYQGYEILANGHILPYFDAASVQLQDTTPSILQNYIDEKAAHGRKDGKGGLSPRSLRLHKNVLHQTLEEAVKSGLLSSNPCQHLILPKVECYPSKFYNSEQLQHFLEAIHNEPMYPLMKITALYGLRRSELLGLKWDSINYDAGTVTIKHTVSKVSKVVEKDKTKNASSYRSYPLTEDARAIFQAAKCEEQLNRKLFGKEYKENDYVFKWPDGHPYSPDYVSHKFSSLLKKHGLEHIRLHELRHSCGSLLMNVGFNLKDVQEWLGHSDIKMTANIYGHLDVGRKHGMAETLSDQLSVIG